MTTKHKTEDYKISAVEYFLISDESQTDVCKIFKCSPRSLLRWVKRYTEEGEIKRHNRKTIAYKVKKAHVKFLLEEIYKNKTITMNELLIKLKEKFKDIELSRIQLSRIIKDNNISLKLTRLRHEPEKRFGKDININKQIKEFYEEIKKYKLDDIVCIDETSISTFQVRQYCYNDIGKRCVIKTKSQEVFKKYTAIFAISNKGVIAWKLYEKSGIDSNRLIKFLKKIITDETKNKVIILDNASSHRNDKIKTFINKQNKLIYSVPYQHYSNGIEQFFSILKNKLQKFEGLTYDLLKGNIKLSIKQIPKETYINIIKGTYNRPEKYVKKVSKKIHKLKNYKD